MSDKWKLEWFHEVSKNWLPYSSHDTEQSAVELLEYVRKTFSGYTYRIVAPSDAPRLTFSIQGMASLKSVVVCRDTRQPTEKEPVVEQKYKVIGHAKDTPDFFVQGGMTLEAAREILKKRTDQFGGMGYTYTLEPPEPQPKQKETTVAQKGYRVERYTINSGKRDIVSYHLYEEAARYECTRQSNNTGSGYTHTVFPCDMPTEPGQPSFVATFNQAVVAEVQQKGTLHTPQGGKRNKEDMMTNADALLHNLLLIIDQRTRLNDQEQIDRYNSHCQAVALKYVTEQYEKLKPELRTGLDNLLRTATETVTKKVREEVANTNFKGLAEGAVEQSAAEFDYSDVAKSAVDDYLENSDYVTDELGKLAEKAVEKAVEEYDFSDWAMDAVNEALQLTNVPEIISHALSGMKLLEEIPWDGFKEAVETVLAEIKQKQDDIRREEEVRPKEVKKSGVWAWIKRKLEIWS